MDFSLLTFGEILCPLNGDLKNQIRTMKNKKSKFYQLNVAYFLIKHIYIYMNIYIYYIYSHHIHIYRCVCFIYIQNSNQFSITSGQGWLRPMLCTRKWVKKIVSYGGVFDLAVEQPQLFRKISKNNQKNKYISVSNTSVVTTSIQCIYYILCIYTVMVQCIQCIYCTLSKNKTVKIK